MKNKVITDKKQVQEVITRGVELVYPEREQLEDLLLSGKRIRLYGGFDPSAPSLHIGNAILINKLGQLQDLGHEVIFLIGDFTGMIGDPTDKDATRKKLTREEVRANCKSFKEQASAYLKFDGDNPAKVMYNSEWLDKLTFKDLIEISSNFTVGRMIQRDMFQDRISKEKPIHLHEFLYPLAQGYDSLAMDVDLEVGGNDQMFNMMAGRDLMKATKGKEKYVMTMKLLADAEGAKMGKTEGNAVFLDQDPNNMYGSVMSWPDEILEPAFELCTRVPMKKLEEIRKSLKKGGTNPRDLKMELAYEITRLPHGDKKAEEARDHFVRTVQQKELPDEIPVKKIKEDTLNIVDLLVEVGLASSKGEAKRLVEQGGIKIDGEVVKDIQSEITPDKELIVQRGKRRFVKIKK